ncbi:hypothetical protein [Amycolatopsis sp.]|uniref:hypothetical protein n=1 Tax=Amycolatopsis sp. TaxID=37632 RepID=UPI002E08CF76|nr:hypothetical protein [Amycolatopsis sp.]
MGLGRGGRLFDMGHPVWPDSVEQWHLTGRWLHPDMCFQADRLSFADDAASLLIGCVDREDPSAPRRFDPGLAPDLHDIGVIAFPLSPHRALTHRWAGHEPDAATLLCAATAVAEAAVHESLELFQSATSSHGCAGFPTLSWPN